MAIINGFGDPIINNIFEICNGAINWESLGALFVRVDWRVGVVR